jgi:heat shock protein HslJ
MKVLARYTKRCLPILVGLAVLWTVLPGCSKATPVTTPVSGTSDITAHPWQLKSYGLPTALESPAAGTLITISFLSNGTAIAGSAGCNAYFGNCQINAKTGGFKVNQSMSTTNRTCESATMTQEQNYLSILKNAQRYTVTAAGLSIVCGKDELNFVPYQEGQ